MKYIRQRLIPILLIENGRLIKTKNFSCPRYLGDPLNALRIFNEKCADEIIIIDKSKHINIDLLDRMVDEAFMPLSYIGGIKTIDDFESVFSLGIEKVGIRSLLFEDISVIQKATKKWGSSSIFAMLDYEIDKKNKINLHYSSAKKNHELEGIIEMIKVSGVGEIVLQNVTTEGTFAGLSNNFIKEFKQFINIPILASGGAVSIKDSLRFISENKISGVAAGSLFSFYGPRKAVLINYDY
jgi:cyclase